ncbi:MAG TPA: AraC family transcriptional regulator ligand-binding domain-containing protein [Kofleriaceae bacterium]
MTTAEPGVSEEIVSTIRRALTELGFDAGQVNASAVGLVVPGSAADELFDRAAEYLLDDALALSLTSRIPIGSLGALDYGLCTSPTVRDALNLVVRYYGVVSQRARLDFVEDGDVPRLLFVRFPNQGYSRHWVEFPIAMIGARIQQTTGLSKQPFTRVAFAHPAPKSRDAHDEFFGCAVEFGAPLDVVEISRELLDAPLHTASKALSELLEQRMKALEPAMATTDPLVDRTRRTLIAMLDAGQTDLETLASKLGESKRTLQRNLSERGTSHSQLLDELRRQRTAELLDRGHKVVDISKALGFSEPSAFFRAYRRWTGTSFRKRGEEPADADEQSDPSDPNE